MTTKCECGDVLVNQCCQSCRAKMGNPPPNISWLVRLAAEANKIAVIRDIAAQTYNTTIEKGFHYIDNDCEKILMMHSELTEAMEAFRNGNPPDSHIPSYSGLEAELADCILRILGYAHARKLRVAEAILAKLEYNKTRPHKHGGKAF